MEEQLSALRQSLQDQTSAARSLTSGLEAQLEDMQKQVAQVTSTRANQIHPDIQTEWPFLWHKVKWMCVMVPVSVTRLNQFCK